MGNAACGVSFPAMKVREIMSRPVVAISPWGSIRTALGLMRENDIGALPVVGEDILVGIVTDRDIAFALAQDATQDTLVCTFMTRHPASCRADEEVARAAEIMGDRQVRRLPVLDRHDRLAGVLSLGDIAERVSEELAGQTLGEICERR